MICRWNCDNWGIEEVIKLQLTNCIFKSLKFHFDGDQLKNSAIYSMQKHWTWYRSIGCYFYQQTYPRNSALDQHLCPSNSICPRLSFQCCLLIVESSDYLVWSSSVLALTTKMFLRGIGPFVHRIYHQDECQSAKPFK